MVTKYLIASSLICAWGPSTIKLKVSFFQQFLVNSDVYFPHLDLVDPIGEIFLGFNEIHDLHTTNMLVIQYSPPNLEFKLEIKSYSISYVTLWMMITKSSVRILLMYAWGRIHLNLHFSTIQGKVILIQRTFLMCPSCLILIVTYSRWFLGQCVFHMRHDLDLTNKGAKSQCWSSILTFQHGNIFPNVMLWKFHKIFHCVTSLFCVWGAQLDPIQSHQHQTWLARILITS